MKWYEEFNPTTFNVHNMNKRKRSDFDKASDDILTFDIEVSSAWDDNGTLIPYIPGMSEGFWNSKKPYALCYIWQFSFNGEVYYGRELHQFCSVLAKLPSDVHFVIWVHNFAYEFEFLCNLFSWESVFARKAHSPMKAVPMLWNNIEFRCSYYLTRMSLETWGKELGLPKLVGFLDYSKLRTPNTKLTDEELAYCGRDCEVVDLGIRKYLEKYKHIEDIPLTQTGEVRKVVKKKMRKSKSDMNWMIKLLPENARMYSILKQTFCGGYTHANYIQAGRTIRSAHGCAFDFASSYPAVMCSEMFPGTAFFPDKFDETKTDKYAYLMKVRFECLEPLTFNHYLSKSKCLEVSDDVKVDNGRIIRGTYATIWITEQDYDIIMKTYECEPHILECYSSRKMYLPKPLVEYVLELYNNKTQYKGLSDKAEIYAISKMFINALFGMCVTDIIQDDVEYYDGGEWAVHEKSVSDVEKYLDDLKRNNKGRTFLAYQFGVWITAYARHNLWECLLSCDKDVIYCDTDSLKIRKRYDFSWYNQKVQAKIEECCKFFGLDPALAAPVDKNGIPHPLGHFDEEDGWTEFKALGAKRYCYRSAVDGQLHLTVSGISKDAVICLKDDIDNFNEETVFDKDYFVDFKETIDNGGHWCDAFDGKTFDEIVKEFKIKDGTKKLHQYAQMQPITWNKGEEDEYHSELFQGIAMRPTSYSMLTAANYVEWALQYILDEDDHLRCIGRSFLDEEEIL